MHLNSSGTLIWERRTKVITEEIYGLCLNVHFIKGAANRYYSFVLITETVAT